MYFLYWTEMNFGGHEVDYNGLNCPPRKICLDGNCECKLNWKKGSLQM